MKRKETLNYRVLTLVTVLGILSLLSTACSAGAAAMADAPSYYGLSKVIGCEEVGNPDFICNNEDKRIVLPIKGTQLDGRVEPIEPDANLVYLIYSNVYSTWNIDNNSLFEGYCSVNYSLMESPPNSSMTETHVIVEKCEN